MKKLIIWTIFAILLMIGCPWLAVEFAGSAGKNIKQLWGLPMIVAGLFLAGVWLLFERRTHAYFIGRR